MSEETSFLSRDIWEDVVAQSQFLTTSIKSLRPRKAYARKSLRVQEEIQSNEVGTSEDTLSQDISAPATLGFESNREDRDRTSLLRPINLSHVKSSRQLMQPSAVPQSVHPEVAVAYGQSHYSPAISNGVTPGDSDGARPTKVLIPTEIHHMLRRTYFETYLEYVYTWCPLLDQELLKDHPEFASSILLNHSIAVVGTNLKPPLVQYEPSFEHYQMARHGFYTRKESNPLITICAIMLFHYWDMTAMNTGNNTDTDWWWLGNAIRLAQEEGLHREGRPSDLSVPFQSLKRRIWWTLFVSTGFHDTLQTYC